MSESQNNRGRSGLVESLSLDFFGASFLNGEREYQNQGHDPECPHPSLLILETARAMETLGEADIPVAGILVNRVLPDMAGKGDFLGARRELGAAPAAGNWPELQGCTQFLLIRSKDQSNDETYDFSLHRFDVVCNRLLSRRGPNFDPPGTAHQTIPLDEPVHLVPETR